MNHAPRISVSWADASGAMLDWSSACSQMVVYEHEADASVTTTHLHILMLGALIDKEGLKKRYKKHIEVPKPRGYWAWEHDDWKKDHPGEEYNINMVTYDSKGKLKPKFIKGVSESEIDSLTSKWVDYSRHAKPGKVEPEKYNEWNQIKEDFIKVMDDKPTLDSVRRWVMAWFWKRDGRFPNALPYKRHVVSLWQVKYEYQHPSIDVEHSSSLHEIINLWY